MRPLPAQHRGRGDVRGEVGALRSFWLEHHLHLGAVAQRDSAPGWAERDNGPVRRFSMLPRMGRPATEPVTGWRGLTPHDSSGSNGIGTRVRPCGWTATVVRNLRCSLTGITCHYPHGAAPAKALQPIAQRTTRALRLAPNTSRCIDHGDPRDRRVSSAVDTVAVARSRASPPQAGCRLRYAPSTSPHERLDPGSAIQLSCVRLRRRVRSTAPLSGDGDGRGQRPRGHDAVAPLRDAEDRAAHGVGLQAMWTPGPVRRRAGGAVRTLVCRESLARPRPSITGRGGDSASEL